MYSDQYDDYDDADTFGDGFQIRSATGLLVPDEDMTDTYHVMSHGSAEGQAVPSYRDPGQSLVDHRIDENLDHNFQPKKPEVRRLGMFRIAGARRTFVGLHHQHPIGLVGKVAVGS